MRGAPGGLSVSGLRIDAPEGVGGLPILEALIINDLCQYHPPSPLIFIESADWNFGTI